MPEAHDIAMNATERPRPIRVNERGYNVYDPASIAVYRLLNGVTQNEAAMPTRCSVCDHKAVRVIDEVLLAGKRSMRSIAADFALGEKAVQRHSRNHLATRATASHATPDAAERAMTSPEGAQRPTVDPGASPLELMRSIVAQLQAVDVEALSATGQREHFNTFRLAVESLAKMEPATPAVVRIVDVEGLGEMMRDFHEGLKDYPGAREMLRDVRRRRTGLPVEEVA